MKHPVAKGFSLIEMAIVVAVVAILSGVAMIHLRNNEKVAEVTVLREMVMQLRSAAGVYASESGNLPVGFDEFVADEASDTVKVLNISAFGKGFCSVRDVTITCTAEAFPSVGSVSFSFHSPENIQLNCPQCNS
jgi:prepilin-type N-terminal cleavage/methylation domain-containing protein